MRQISHFPSSFNAGLYTDFYELTMAEGFFFSGMADTAAGFDYFFRKAPFGGGYVVFAGLADLLELLENLRFDAAQIDFLRERGFREEFLGYLTDLRFTGTIFSPREGDLVFAGEPVARVEGPIIEAQLIETLLLNILNFESLIATKTARIVQAARGKSVVDFGLRRAQGFGGVHASRAAIIGGAVATSNTHAAHIFDVEPSGTQAHSWVQSFESELAAFQAFARIYPDKCILLLDTYDTLRSGLPNAITVARELERAGHQLAGVRLDSGNIAQLSKNVRATLDREGFGYVKIVASNKLDEFIIADLLNQDAPIDAFGVGTSLVTGAPDGALDGVYKLSLVDDKPRLKISESEDKINLPGRKKVFRLMNESGELRADAVTLADEQPGEIFNPATSEPLRVEFRNARPLHQRVIQDGRLQAIETRLSAIADYAGEQLERLPSNFKRFDNADAYPVGVSAKLLELRRRLVEEQRAHFRST